jgi:hypothetical protein
MSSPKSFERYRDALNALSIRTRTPLPSLIASFAVLHELTAIASLVGIFFGARALGVGERVVQSVINDPRPGWIREKCRTWVVDGESWARRVGKRYGVFGLEKDDGSARGHLAGDVANAVVAYGMTKVSQVDPELFAHQCCPGITTR